MNTLLRRLAGADRRQSNLNGREQLLLAQVLAASTLPEVRRLDQDQYAQAVAAVSRLGYPATLAELARQVEADPRAARRRFADAIACVADLHGTPRT